MRWPFSAFSVLESRRPIIRSESRTEDTSGACESLLPLLVSAEVGA